jgi:uncharacterized protein (DUF736 family)
MTERRVSLFATLRLTDPTAKLKKYAEIVKKKKVRSYKLVWGSPHKEE